MSYPSLPAAGSAETAAALRALLGDLAGRKEFSAFGRRTDAPDTQPAPHWEGFVPDAAPLYLPGLRLNGAQLFIRNFENPDTEYSRVLIKWQTGTGKSIAAISIGNEFIRQFRARAAIGERAPTVFIISFTARETIQEDMLRHPEFGFVSQAEVEELRRLRAAVGAAGGASPEARHLSGLLGALRRRTTDRSRGGYYRFYGYKEFASRLFAVTRQGLARGFDVQALYGRAKAEFGARLAEAVRRGDVAVDEDLLDEMREGLLVADEIHNVYNILENNNYGIAVQYALDALGAEAPRAVFMSATPMTGSAAEVVDLLNLLVPRSALPGGAPLRRSDFFVAGARPPAKAAAKAAAKAPAAEGVPEDAAPTEGAPEGAPEDAAPAEDAPEGAPEDEPAEGAAPAEDEPRDAEDEPAEGDEAGTASQLLEGALERIAHLSAGRVSFLLDSDVGSYPRRLFVGEEVAGVPYLRLTPCPMSPFHARTLAREQQGGGPAGGLAANAYTLYDMAFPNPAFAPDAAAAPGGAYGLYLSGDTPTRLGQAAAEWRAAAGVIVEKGAEAGVSAGTYVVTGPFLGPGRLPLYSAKFARVVAATLDAVRAGPGKVMIYHHRVRMSGVLLLQEALRMNGFADETSEPTDATICGVCGVARAAHAPAPAGAPAPAPAGAAAPAAPAAPAGAAGAAAPAGAHTYAPARAVVAHSDVDRAVMVRSIARFNAPTNLHGHQYRVLIGSKIVREGLNFRGVRHQLVASLPTDYPTMVQVFGRVVRKDSHSDLPAGERDVRIRVFVSTRADGQPSPELQRYIDKGREFLVIQEVERALHEYAVDGFANYERIRRALHARPGGELRASLDALPYSPVAGAAGATGAREATFLAYGHGEREVATLEAICRVLFRARPVWTYDDLWAAVRAGAVRGANLDRAALDEGNFALALEGLRRPAGEPPALVARAGRFYVAARAAPGGRPAADVESYLRAPPAAARVSVRLADYVREARSGQNWAVQLREFERAYLAAGAAAPAELSLVEYSAAFHYALIRRLVVAGAGAGAGAAAAGAGVTLADERMRELYRRFRVVVTAADAAAPAAARVFRGGASPAPDALVGYVTPEAVSLYDAAGGRWYSASHADFAIGRRHTENDILVGFVTAADGAGAGASAGAGAGAGASARARFKVRLPVQQLQAAAAERAADRRADARGLARGAVCETRPRTELETHAKRLRAAGRFTGPLAARLGYAAEFDRALQERLPNASDLCTVVRLHLLALEEDARAPAGGMATGLRWLYLFNDRPPSVAALVGRGA